MTGCVDFTLDDFESVSVVVSSFACDLLATRRALKVVGAVLDDAGYVALYKVARSFFVVDEQERFAFFAEDFDACSASEGCGATSHSERGSGALDEVGRFAWGRRRRRLAQ